MAPILISLTIGLPWIGAVLVWIAGWKRSETSDPGRLQHTLAVVFSAAAGLAAIGLLGFTGSKAVIRLPFGQYFGELTFIPDILGVYLAIIATVIGCFAVIFSIDYMHGDPHISRYYFMVLFFIGGMAGLVLTGSLLFLFLFWEITALCSYALIAYYNDDPKAVAGGIKALIITQIGGVGLLMGALVAYAQTGSFEIQTMLARAGGFPASLLGLVAFGFLVAAAAKSAQAPFHTWLPDAMEAPTPISALIHAATMVNAGVYLLARFYPAFEEVPYWKTAVVVVGCITALLAAVMAMFAFDLKRVLAYSTVSQLGYMVYAIGAGGIFASQFHLMSHSVFKALLFLSAGAIIHTIGTRDMRQMGRQNVAMPFVRTVFIIGALALAGIPILNGFWSKELVLEAGLAEGPSWAYVLMVIGAGLTAFYTYRMVWMVFFADNQEPIEGHIHDAPTAMRIALAPLAFGALVTWLLAGPFSKLMRDTLPFHEIHIENTWRVALQIITEPATWLALAVIAIGLAAWHYRASLEWLTRPFRWLGPLARSGFGFEDLNRWVVKTINNAADSLRILQTGQLNWNMVGIIIGTIAILVWFAWAL